MIGFGLLGGLILNLMPCVLPVIGLKVLSFVQHGGHSRGTIFALNLWFALGLLSVFMVLATAAAFANLGWGQQFTYTWFKVAMVIVVFAFALSFLGVWEVPIPGFAQSSTSDKLQHKEGASGAFFKGIFTTLLATPAAGRSSARFRLYARSTAAGHIHHFWQRRPRHGLALFGHRCRPGTRSLASQAR